MLLFLYICRKNDDDFFLMVVVWIVQTGEQLVRVGQDTRLNYRVLDMRTPANQAIFRIQCHVENVSYITFQSHLPL